MYVRVDLESSSPLTFFFFFAPARSCCVRAAAINATTTTTTKSDRWPAGWTPAGTPLLAGPAARPPP